MMPQQLRHTGKGEKTILKGWEAELAISGTWGNKNWSSEFVEEEEEPW